MQAGWHEWRNAGEEIGGVMSEDKKAIFLYYWRALVTGKDQPVLEYPFDKQIGRKHRFDLAWPEYKVAVEINGQAWHTMGGGRHGKDSDLEKLNLAVSMGWKVYQFSPQMLKDNPERWIDMVRAALN
jgi:very-short-patch-repair endonuclease